MTIKLPEKHPYLDGSPNYLPGTSIEVVNRAAQRGRFRCALFDFDGTISLLREGWQGIMAPMMVEMICGDHPPTPEIEEEVRRYVAESTGIQTIFQMEHLVEMVRQHGLVPPDKILDAWGYKEIYNERLMRPVKERLARLASGQLSVEQVTLRGSIEFVKALYERGLTLYVFSGTDAEDVKNEVTAVGVAAYFAGGIFGALRPVEAYSKDKIIKEILRQYGLSGPEILVVGDGPVEILNAKENNAIALGVASDEVRGHGLNPSKRERLIRAGADILIPDFGELQPLLAYLFPTA